MKIKNSHSIESQIYQDALTLRKQVFIDEQKVPKEIEIDDKEASCIHFVLYQDELALATARFYPLKENQLKLQRMAVSSLSRGKGLGGILLDHMIDYAREHDYTEIQAHAQISALNFYQAHGFKPYGPIFEEASILHQNVHLTLN